MATSIMRIDVATLGLGTPGEARSEAAADYAKQVTVTSTGSGVNHALVMLTTNDPSFVSLGGPGPWTFTPSGSGYTYRLQLTVDDGSSASEVVSVHTYEVRTDNFDHGIPAPNEGADPDASSINNGPAVVEASNNNIGGNYYGWQPNLDNWLREVDLLAKGTDKLTAATANAWRVREGTDDYIAVDTNAGTITLGSPNIDVYLDGGITQVDTTNLVVEDPLIVLARNQAGAPTYDSGIVVERGSSTNVAFMWDESADEFVAVTTAEDGTTAGNVTIVDYADIHVANLSLSERSGDPTNLTDTGFVYTKEVSTVTELFYIDDTGAVTQLTGAGLSGTGTTNISWTVNEGAVPADGPETTCLILRGGDGVAGPNDDVVQTHFCQVAADEYTHFWMERDRNGGGLADIDANFQIGQNATTSAVSSILQFNAGTGGASETQTITLDTAGTLIFTGGVQAFRGAAGSSTSTFIGCAGLSSIASSVGVGSVTFGGSLSGQCTLVGAGANNVNALGCTAIGNAARCTGQLSVAVGINAQAGADGVTIGSNSTATANGAVTIGHDNDSTGAYTVSLGWQATANATGAIALGADSYTATVKQMVVGSLAYPITDVVFGEGSSVATTETDYGLRTSTKSDTGVAADFTIKAGDHTLLVAGDNAGSLILQGGSVPSTSAGTIGSVSVQAQAVAGGAYTDRAVFGPGTVVLGNATDNPQFSWLGTGDWTVSGAVGTAGQALISTGSGTAPEWGAPAGVLDGSGTTNISWTVNEGAVAADGPETTCLILRGGDGVAATNDDVVQSHLCQVAVDEYTHFWMDRNRNGGGEVEIAANFQIGQNASIADLDPVLQFNAGTGAAAVTQTITLNGTGDLLSIGDGSGSVTIAGVGSSSVRIGDGATAPQASTVTIGDGTIGGATFADIVIGAGSSGAGSTTYPSVIIGNSAGGTGCNAAVLIGYSADNGSVGAYVTAVGGVSSASRARNVAIGHTAIASGDSDACAFGSNSLASAGSALAAGNGAIVSAIGGIAVGRLSVVDATYGVAVGAGADVDAGAYGSIALGAYANATAAKQLVIGSVTYPITDIYVGEGVSAVTVETVYTIAGSTRSTTGVDAANLAVKAGDHGSASSSDVAGTLLLQGGSAASGAIGGELKLQTAYTDTYADVLSFTRGGVHSVTAYQGDGTAGKFATVRYWGGTETITNDTVTTIVTIDAFTSGAAHGTGRTTKYFEAEVSASRGTSTYKGATYKIWCRTYQDSTDTAPTIASVGAYLSDEDDATWAVVWAVVGNNLVIRGSGGAADGDTEWTAFVRELSVTDSA